MTDALRYEYKTEPYAHQKRALAKVARLDGKAGLFMPMRTGKTKATIDWVGIAYHNLGLRRVLIVCPISVIDVWREEIAKHLPDNIHSYVSVLRDTATQNSKKMQVHVEAPLNEAVLHFVIVNYEMVWRKVTEVGPRFGHTEKPLDKYIAEWKPDLVVADEAHKLKNPMSQQSKSLARLGQAARMRLALTGTPVAKAPLDLYGLFRFIDPAVFDNMTWAQFKDHYADWAPAKYEPRIKEVVRYKNVPELVEKTRRNSFRVKLEECFDLPAEQPPVVIRVPLPMRVRRIYDDMATEMIAELEGGKVATADIVLEKLMRLSQITSGFVKDENGDEVDIHDVKLDALMDLVRNVVEQDEKIVVFTRFVHDYERISRRLTQGGISHAMLTGQTKPDERADNIRLFQSDPSVPVFVSQIQSGSVGIDLSAARLLAFYSLDYNWVNYIQAKQRILNPRNPRPLGYYHLVCPSTVDVVQMRVLRERGNMAEALIHNPRALLDDA